MPCQNNYKLEIYGAPVTKRGPHNSEDAEDVTSEDDLIEAWVKMQHKFCYLRSFW